MEQINTYALFLLGKWLDSVFLSARMPLQRNILAWHSAGATLDILISGDAKFKLDESAKAAVHLRDIIDSFLKAVHADPSFAINDDQLQMFNTAWSSFEQALALDLGRAPIFFVTDKGIFATTSLIANAANHLVKDVRDIISDEAKEDMTQAGRCLAFGLSTAVGYHALRAVEKVLREYYVLLVKKSPDKIRMKQVIDELAAHGADKKTMAVFDQLRDLHRNPIDHPDVFLEPSEAFELFNICTTAISAVARQIKKLKP